MAQAERWQSFLTHLNAFGEITLVGPFAAQRKEWPTPSIFIDAGARHKSSHPLHFSVGDGDSADVPLDFTLPAEKDYSDLAFVLSQLPNSIIRLSMVGFLGGRKDHELLNLGEVHRFLTRRSVATECDIDWSVCGLSAGQWVLKLNGLFSLVAFTPIKAAVTGDCRYQLKGITELEAFSTHGLSNEAWGQVALNISGPVFIFKNPFT